MLYFQIRSYRSFVRCSELDSCVLGLFFNVQLSTHIIDRLFVSVNLGRHNHGPAWFNDPWSGFYQLAAPFYTQAQFTQFTEIGWKFIASGVGHTGCTGEINAAGQPYCDLTYASLASPDETEFSVVIVSLSNQTELLRLELAGSLAKYAGLPLQHWSSTEHAYFTRQADLIVPKTAPLSLSIPSLSVVTISNRKQTGGWANYTVPPRTRFPLPFDGSIWEQQAIDEPCRGSNPIWGAFEIATDATAGTTDNKVCRQAVPANPGGNAWTHRHNAWPVTTLPSGSNLANLDISIRAKMIPNAGVSSVAVCGRIPIWSPSACQEKTDDNHGWAPGVCLAVIASGTSLTWRLTEAHNMYNKGACKNFTVLASGESVAGAAGDWRNLSLSFDDSEVTASIDGVAMPSARKVHTSMPAGVAGFATAWNIAHFTNFLITPHADHPATPGSFIFDVLPSEVTISDFSGWAGMIMDLTAGKYLLRGT